MKKIWLLFILFLFLLPCFSQNNPQLTTIPRTVFLNNTKGNFTAILYRDSTLRKKVAFLHAHNELDHDLNIHTNTFEEYWNAYRSQWMLIKFHKNDEPLLIFQGIKNYNDERGYVQLYNLNKPLYHQLVFNSVGALLAYKRQPHTGGLILYIHDYPCCHSASHNIKIIREINGTIHIRKRFFVGRDRGNDMVGPFFPKEAQFSASYSTLKKKTILRWSPAIITQNAFLPRTQKNILIAYNKGAKYKILYDNGKWQFVLFTSGIAHERSRMLNYTNFLYTGIYGWIKKEESQ